METRTFAVCALHSDMTDRERDFLVGNFSRLLGASADEDTGAADGTSLVLVCTDVGLRPISRDLLPLGLPLLIHYDLPLKKEVHSRRLASIFGGARERAAAGVQRSGGGGAPAAAAGNVTVSFVVAGEVALFRGVEKFGPGPILEMPVYVADIFKPLKS